MSRTAIRTMLVIVAAAACVIAAPLGAAFQEEVQYKKFKLDDVSCDAGVVYRRTDLGLDIGVSAIATGKGAEFRKWEVTDIRMRMSGEAVRPDKSEKFYTTEESFFRVPAAILFAAIGTQIHVAGSSLEKGVAKAGVALGLGLLVLQARGEIAGEKCLFRLTSARAADIREGQDAIEVTVENRPLHRKETIKIAIVRAPREAAAGRDYDAMTTAELGATVDRLALEVAALEEEQKEYRYGEDPRYDAVGQKIETLQAERGLAYTALLARREEDRYAAESE